MPKSPNYPVPALEKGLDILEALAAAAVPQSLSELAARLERSSSELFRMLNCLERRGYLTRDPVSGKFGLSLKLFALGHEHSSAGKLLAAARGPMQALTGRFRESCHLSVLERGRLLVLAQEESPEHVRLSIEVGGTFEPERTASGRLLLAFSGGAGADDAGAKGKAAASGELVRELARIRREGVSTARSETIEGVRDLAVLVGRPEAGVTAALAVTRLLRRGETTDEAALLAGMKATAKQITVALGLQE